MVVVLLGSTAALFLAVPQEGISTVYYYPTSVCCWDAASVVLLISSNWPSSPEGTLHCAQWRSSVSDTFKAPSIDARSGLQTYLHLNQKLCPCVLLVCILGAGSVWQPANWDGMLKTLEILHMRVSWYSVMGAPGDAIVAPWGMGMDMVGGASRRQDLVLCYERSTFQLHTASLKTLSSVHVLHWGQYIQVVKIKHWPNCTHAMIFGDTDAVIAGMVVGLHWVSPRRRQWHPTPVLLPGKSHGRRSLVGCSLWGH